MLAFFPFLGWLATATSVVTLIMLASAGDLRVRSGVLFLAILLGAAYCQFGGFSPVIAALGLGVQTLLAIVLMVRWRLGP